MKHRLFRLFLLCLCLTLLPVGSLAVEFGDFSDKFADKFLPEGESVIVTDTEYRSQDIAITFTTMRQDGTDIYVADVYVRSVENMQQAYAGGDWNVKTLPMNVLARENEAVLSITGDSASCFPGGLVVGNGAVKRESPNPERDLCIIYRDGTMETILAQEVDNAAVLTRLDSIWQVFVFGPELLDDEGRAMTMPQFNSDVASANPRSAIGYYEPGHYCFVQVDGRGATSKLKQGYVCAGYDMEQLSQLMESLGCTMAYNLDGGRSSSLCYGDEIISSPYMGGRPIGVAVIIKELREVVPGEGAAE